MEVYVLQHAHKTNEYVDVKLIGLYSSRDEALAAVDRLSNQPGFADATADFAIDAYKVDNRYWANGFVCFGEQKVEVPVWASKALDAHNSPFRAESACASHFGSGSFPRGPGSECEQLSKTYG